MSSSLLAKTRGNFPRRPGGTRPAKRLFTRPELPVPEHLIGASIFASDSPKAYAPIAYAVLGDAPVIDYKEFAREDPLPQYPSIPPREVDKPLGATFVDTESERPNFAGLSRPKISKEDTEGKDILYKLVLNYSKNPLRLGTEEVPYPKPLLSSNIQKPLAPPILKRSRNSGTDQDHEGTPAKKQRREVRMNFDGEEDINDGIVQPENVLRMVDSSLVESPEQHQQRRNRDPYRRPISSGYSRPRPYPPYGAGHRQAPPAPPPPPPVGQVGPEDAFNNGRYRNSYPQMPPAPGGYDNRYYPYGPTPVQGRYEYDYDARSGGRRRPQGPGGLQGHPGPSPQGARPVYGDYQDPRSAFYGQDYGDPYDRRGYENDRYRR